MHCLICNFCATVRNFCRQVNPFRDRICAVFSSCQDGMLSFEDFLDMMSVFSDNCPKNLKVEYAFRIYGECWTAISRVLSISIMVPHSALQLGTHAMQPLLSTNLVLLLLLMGVCRMRFQFCETTTGFSTCLVSSLLLSIA